MSGLKAIIKAQIRASGPMNLADYMALCLGHPDHGFYMTSDPLGTEGHFTTAPEISQMFGELIGLWLAQAWAEQGSPNPVRLIELGPGRGTLMADALRAAGAVPGFAEAADLWLVETSRALRAEQARRLPGAHWAERLEQVPQGPALIVANEFFDALPVRQFLATSVGWREKQVGIEDDRLVWGLSAPLPGQREVPEGAWREESSAAQVFAGEVARRISGDGGAALIIDYGFLAADRPSGFTLQALRRHAPADPLKAPGSADLTWLIDFDHLARALCPLATACVTQGEYLTTLGIGQRAASLANSQPDQADAIADALERLTGADQMGRLFKVLAAWPQGTPAPPGFEETA